MSDAAEKLIPAAATLLSTGAGVASSLMNKPKASSLKIAAPTPVKPTVMPVEDSERTDAARRRAIEQRMNNSGRGSTILSQDALGG